MPLPKLDVWNHLSHDKYERDPDMLLLLLSTAQHYTCCPQRSAAQRSTAQHSTDKEVVLAFMAHLRTKSDASVPYLLKDLR